MAIEQPILLTSVNLWRRGPGFTGRLHRIAAKLREDAPAVGILALQETTRPLGLPWSANGARVLARSLEREFAVAVSRCHAGNVGIIAGPEFEMLARRAWRLGRDTWRRNAWSWPSARYLLEAELRHVATGGRLRFYATHLSHRDAALRLEQTARIVDIVRGRAQPGEAPPLVAGDFNAAAGSDVAGLMGEHFTLLHHDSVDLIWSGRPELFPAASGSCGVEGTSLVDLLSEGLCDAHNAPRVRLTVDSTADEERISG